MAGDGSLAAVIARIQAIGLTVSGISEAPAYMPDSEPQFPFIVCIPETVEWKMIGADIDQAIYRLRIEIHFQRQNLAEDIEIAVPYDKAFMTALLDDPTLNGLVHNITTGTDIPGTFGMLLYNDRKHIGWSYLVSVKLQYAASR